jgi:hypothetical protein
MEQMVRCLLVIALRVLGPDSEGSVTIVHGM